MSTQHEYSLSGFNERRSICPSRYASVRHIIIKHNMSHCFTYHVTPKSYTKLTRVLLVKSWTTVYSKLLCSIQLYPTYFYSVWDIHNAHKKGLRNTICNCTKNSPQKDVFYVFVIEFAQQSLTPDTAFVQCDKYNMYSYLTTYSDTSSLIAGWCKTY